ncbi:MAG: hypothetical protein ABW034_23895 [Steroidobacteraceae bacterium]
MMKSLLLIAAGILATADQDNVEVRGLTILQSAPVQQQIIETRRIYAADPMAVLPGGKVTLDNAVKELAWAAVLVGVNTESSQPKIAWVYNAPRTWRGRTMPGSRWGIDNPDNVYRIAPIDGVSDYKLYVRRHGEGPLQFSFLVYSHFVTEDGHQDEVDKPIAGLKDTEVVWNSDGSFTLTIDPKPTNGRPNHIQSPPNAKQLLIRNTLGDWSRQLPLEMSIERVGGPPAAAAGNDELAQRSAKFLDALTSLSLNWKSKSLFGQWHDNTFSEPFGRGMKWGYAASANFNLADDEALVVTVDPLDAKYVGFMLMDLWLASLDHVGKSGSLNGTQALPSADGTYTYVVAAKDPGFYNWLDTGGLNQGSMLYRWQVLPPTRSSAKGAVKSAKVVKFAELRNVLPADAKFISAAERKEVLLKRKQEYERRYSP